MCAMRPANKKRNSAQGSTTRSAAPSAKRARFFAARASPRAESAASEGTAAAASPRAAEAGRAASANAPPVSSPNESTAPSPPPSRCGRSTLSKACERGRMQADAITGSTAGRRKEAQIGRAHV